MSGVARWQSVIVGYDRQSMFGKGVSVDVPVGSSYLIDSLVERDAAPVGLDNEFNRLNVVLGNVIISDADYFIYIYLGGSLFVILHTHSPVKGHNNPLDKEGYEENFVTLSSVCVKNAPYQSLEA